VTVIALTVALSSGNVFAESAFPKNPKAAAFLSVLVPGVGELYAGGGKSGRFFLFTEATFWVGWAAFKQVSNTRRSTFQSYAAAHSGVQAEGKPNSFFDQMNRFTSIYDRNTSAELRNGSDADLIPETAENIWEWDSDASRLAFQELRSRETSARQKSLMFVGALVFNRFASAINAASIARTTQPAAPAVSMEVGMDPVEDRAMAAVRWRF
jgi:hypothetical protein